jgi:uncharacterized protein
MLLPYWPVIHDQGCSMAILSELIVYPIKSCAGISLPEAVLTSAGLAAGGVSDREWMVVGDDGQFLTQREYPRMALVTPHLSPGTLVLRAPGMAMLELALEHVPNLPGSAQQTRRDVHIWDDTLAARDCGEAAAAWFSQAIGVRCRLVRFDPNTTRIASAKWTGGVKVPTLFSDGYPFLVIGSASLADLNGKLLAAGRAALPMNRFRPNLVIDGIEPFEEDYVESFQLGDALLKPVKPCPRCPMPSIDQASGVAGPDPLDILRTYRGKPQLDDAICFGMNSIVIAGGGERLHAGQEITLTLAF